MIVIGVDTHKRSHTLVAHKQAVIGRRRDACLPRSASVALDVRETSPSRWQSDTLVLRCSSARENGR